MSVKRREGLEPETKETAGAAYTLVVTPSRSAKQIAVVAAIFAQHHCDTRQAGQLYGAWRQGKKIPVPMSWRPGSWSCLGQDDLSGTRH